MGLDLRVYLRSKTSQLKDFYPSTCDVKVGRNDKPGRNDIVIEDPYISSTHAHLYFLPPTDGLRSTGVLASLTDVSRNGCWVNGVQVAMGTPVHLRDGDELMLSNAPINLSFKPPILGKVAYMLVDLQPPPPPEPPRPPTPEAVAAGVVEGTRSAFRRATPQRAREAASQSQSGERAAWEGSADSSSQVPQSQYEAPFSQSQDWNASQLLPLPPSQEAGIGWDSAGPPPRQCVCEKWGRRVLLCPRGSRGVAGCSLASSPPLPSPPPPQITHPSLPKRLPLAPHTPSLSPPPPLAGL
jgi:hypothetical protein